MFWVAALVLVLGVGRVCVAEDELAALVVVFRHGERTPEDFYNDPYVDESYWPEGYGQLTNAGKQREYALGKWLRQRYSTYIPETYSPSEIYVRGDDVDRIISSALLNMAALFPPKGDQVWTDELQWQPVPVHTRPSEEDPLVGWKKPCPKHDKLYDKLMDTDYFKKVQKQNQDLYDYLTENTGITFKTLKKVRKIFVTLSIEESRNLTLPEWTKSIYPDKLKPIADFSYATFSYTDELAELRVGPMLYSIKDYFKNVTESLEAPKVIFYSGHDKNIAEILTAFGAYDYEGVQYGATILFELRKNSGGYYVNVLYKKGDEVIDVKVRSCSFDCDFATFFDILDPVSVPLDQWDKKCEV